MGKDSSAVILTGVGIAVVAAFVILIFLAVNRRTGTIRDLLRSLAASAGWTDLRNVFFAAAGVKGMWRSFPAQLSYHARQKGVPQRLILTVTAQTDTALIVKRRFSGVFGNKPLAWFGPPLIEVHQPAAEGFWVRGDVMLADRFFSEASLASKISENVVARFDEIRIDRKGLRITRALDDRRVRQKYGLPAFSMGFNAAQFEPIAREELALAEALAGKLTMR
jgi:hypothetical protein